MSVSGMYSKLIVWVFIPIGVFLFLRFSPSQDVVWIMPKFHFFIVSVVSILATLFSAFIAWVAAHIRNISVLLLALAFTSLAGFFAIHGLATPGFLVDDDIYHLPGVAAQLCLTTCAAWLYFSILSPDSILLRMISRHRSKITFGWLLLIGVMAALGLKNPGYSNWIPVDSSPLKFVMATITITLFLRAANVYWSRYRFARFPLQLAVTYSISLLCIVQVILITTDMWTRAWWFYHILLLLATTVVLFGVVKQYNTGPSIFQSVHRMFSSDPVERIFSSISSSVKALVVATEAKDKYTAGHNFRVAMYALQLADEVHLSPEMLRALSQAGVVHDVGKIELPEALLNKPGALTLAERALMEHHPVAGYEMCKQLGFMREELEVVRHHHEKWDGSGYPDKLKGNDIPLLARILAIADVYDALTSLRAYRNPWTHEQAMKYLVDNAGIHFDPTLVTAWVNLCSTGKVVFPSYELQWQITQ